MAAPRRIRLTAALFAASLCTLGAARTPDLVLITIDTLRADHLHCYGYARGTSPEIDRFARDALLFENVVAPMPATLPTHVSLFTSTYPARHGVQSNFRSLRPAPSGNRLRTLAEQLRARGYETAGFTSASPLSRGTGIDLGFDHFDAPPPASSSAESLNRRGAATLDAALAWLEEARAPFFLWVHLFDPHLPYDPPPPYADAFQADASSLQRLTERGVPQLLLRYAARAVDRYDGEILYADAQVGRLLRALRERGLYQGAVIALTADHGEGLMQHGDIAHERLFAPQLRVPLIVRTPGGPSGRTAALTSSIDVLPLLRAHSELPLDDSDFDGVDPLADARGAALAQEAIHGARGERTFALVEGRWKYFHLEGAAGRLYDLQADPGETTNVLELHPEVGTRMRTSLEALVAKAEASKGLEVSESIDPDLADQLEALGYTR